MNFNFDHCHTFEEFCEQTGTNGRQALELIISELNKIKNRNKKSL